MTNEELKAMTRAIVGTMCERGLSSSEQLAVLIGAMAAIISLRWQGDPETIRSVCAEISKELANTIETVGPPPTLLN